MGEGQDVRDWIHEEDHCLAIDLIIQNGKERVEDETGFAAALELLPEVKETQFGGTRSTASGCMNYAAERTATTLKTLLKERPTFC
jgi:hypothetical protein